MEDRIARFIAALRASGVRVSVAESQDAWRAIQILGVMNREAFRMSLRTTLVKEAADIPTFEELFPLYFGQNVPPLIDPQTELSAEQQKTLQDSMEQMSEQLAEQLKQLLEWLLSGHGPTQQALEDLAQQAGEQIQEPSRFASVRARQQARQMQEMLGWEEIEELLNQLWEKLAEQGMNPDTIEQLKARVAENMERLQQQLGDIAGQQVRDQSVDEKRRRKPVNELMDRNFGSLSQPEMEQLRDEVRRLASRLRSRAALRQKRGKQGKLDPKATIRANQRYSGIPFDLHYKQRRLKPRIVAILDISTSMRPVAEFFLRMLYELQDQVQKTRSFAFIDHLEDISSDMSTRQIDDAVYTVLTRLPPGHYNTDLGYSLRQFEEKYFDTIDSRTTVIILGDGRNNFNDPGLHTFSNIGRRARRLIWMNPEYPAQWGKGDSDMPAYAPLCTDVYQVRNLSQLADAVDRILT